MNGFSQSLLPAGGRCKQGPAQEIGSAPGLEGHHKLLDKFWQENLVDVNATAPLLPGVTKYLLCQPNPAAWNGPCQNLHHGMSVYMDDTPDGCLPNQDQIHLVPVARALVSTGHSV